eukprot:Em0023g45a
MASLVEFDFPQLGWMYAGRQTEEPSGDPHLMENFDIWRRTVDELVPIPTPPLSPDRLAVDPGQTNDIFDSDPLFSEFLNTQQIMACDDYASGESQANEMELLIQDCMWNGQNCATQVLSMCTPDPSPTPVEIPEPTTAHCCVDPSNVFPTGLGCSVKQEERDTSDDASSSRPSSDALTPLHPGHSESDEEIDVVTVIERPKKQPLRKRNVSVSAPCSLQNSPVGSPVKKRRYSAKRLQRLSSVGSNVTDNGESDDEQRRASHNILERKRRNDLKYSFQILRGQIPELEDNQKAPKVTILRKAAEYIVQIQDEARVQEDDLLRERDRQQELQQRLKFLQSF